MTHGRWTRTGAATATLAAVLLTGACGGDPEPLRRSTLSMEVPSIPSVRLVEALPEPADLGAGWRFRTESLGSDDYFGEFLGSVLPKYCPDADAQKAGIPRTRSAYAVSGAFESPAGGRAVAVLIGVDAPARSADRLAMIRRAYTECDTIEFQRDGEDYERKVEVRDAPGADADETLAIRVTDEWKGDRFVVDGVFARVGGLVVNVVWQGGDPRPLLRPVLAEARTALGI